MINRIKGKITFLPNDNCKVCNERIWYDKSNIEITNNDGYITCPYCGNVIKINNYERYPL